MANMIVEFPRFTEVSLPHGYVINLMGCPLLVDSTGPRVVSSHSSRYVGRIHFADLNLRKMILEARYIPGTAVVMIAEEEFSGYNFWLLSFLPRLSSVLGREDITIVVGDDVPEVHFETLELLGIPREKVIQLPKSQAIRAETVMGSSDNLLEPSQLAKIRLENITFLRRLLMQPVQMQGSPKKLTRSSKLFIVSGRNSKHVLDNQERLIEQLSVFGFCAIDVETFAVEDQIRIFAEASHIIGLYGPGLANIVFSPPGTRVIEIFPHSKASPIHYFVAAQLQMPYATFLGTDVGEKDTWGRSVVHIEPSEFIEKCGDLV